MPAERRTYRAQRSFRMDVVALCALLALGAVVLGVFSWSKPTKMASTVTYIQTGAFSYKGLASAASAYGAKGVVTREPVLLTVVKDLTVTYTYRISAPSRIDAKGTDRMAMRLSNDQGLVRTVPLTPARPFAHDGFSATWTLPLKTVTAVASSFAPGGHGSGGPVSVAFVPQVTVVGSVAGAPLRTSFHQATKFTLASTTLTPLASSTPQGAASPRTQAADVGRAMTTTATGSLSVPDSRVATLAAGVTILNGRIASVAVLVAALVGLAFAGLPLRKRMNSADERVRIDARFGAALVPVGSLPGPPETVSVEVGSFEGLMQVARQLECPVLHLEAQAFDQYAVVESGTVYHYRVDPAGRIVESAPSNGSPPRGRHLGSNRNGAGARARTV